MAEEEKNEEVTSFTVEDQEILRSDSTVSPSTKDKNDEICDNSTLKETEENCHKSTPKEIEENCDKSTPKEIEENCDKSTPNENEEKCDNSPPKEIEENCDKSTVNEIEEKSESEKASHKAIVASSSSSSFKFGLLDLVTQIDPRSQPLQWYGFLRKLSRVPSASLLAFNPYLPSLPSIKRTKKKPSRKHTLSMPDIPPSIDPNLYCFEPSWTIYSLSDLKDATNNFDHDNLIGEGGYSEVFKGELQDGQIIAVKRLIRGTQEEMTADFLSELGILVHVNHPNISNVIGYGVEGGMYLVLPLSHHGSLASLLSGNKEKLDWRIRYNIALGTASGLSYLHEGCQRRIIHRDIKAANILLSEDFEPRIADFGLAKWLPDQWTHLNVSHFEGTFGYLAPEVFMNGLVDEKTDVYAYGVLLLEIITGRPALDQAQKSLVMWARPLINEKDIEKLVDPHLDGECEFEQLSDMLWIVSQCISHCPTERPKMSQVYRMLSGAEGIPDSKKFMKWAAFRRRKKSTEVFEELLKVKDHPASDQTDGVLEGKKLT